MPPAIRTTFSRRRAAAVKTPNGPSATTRVPGATSASRLEKSPSALTVMRSERPSGARESENGCDAHQRPFVRKRQRKNWPGRASSRSSRRPSIRSETTPGPSAITSATRRRKRNACTIGASSRKTTSERDRREGERAPVVGRDAVEHELVAGRDLVEPGERDPRIRQEVHGVPGLVAEAAPHDHDRGHDDGDEQARRRRWR